MSLISNWNKDLPSGDSDARIGDDLLREHWTVLEAAWEEEHYFTDASGVSTGEHKPGSMRPFIGTYSQVSSTNVTDEGRLLFDSDTSRYWYVGSDKTFPLGAGQGLVVEHYPPLEQDSDWSGLAGVQEMSAVLQTKLFEQSATSTRWTFPIAYAANPRISLSWWSTSLDDPFNETLVTGLDTSFATISSVNSAGTLEASNATVTAVAVGPVRVSLLSNG